MFRKLKLGLAILALSTTQSIAQQNVIKLVWNYPTNVTISGFKLQRSIDGGKTWTDLDIVIPSTSRTTQDTTVKIGTEYCYHIAAFSSQEISTWSNMYCKVAGGITPPTLLRGQ